MMVAKPDMYSLNESLWCGFSISRWTSGLIVPLQLFFFFSPLEALDVLLKTAARERRKRVSSLSLLVNQSNQTLDFLELF